MKALFSRFKKQETPAEAPAAVPDASIFWLRWEYDTSGRYFCKVQGSKTSPEYTFEDAEKMRKLYDSMLQKYSLISLAPDFAVNAHKVDALTMSKEKLSVIFSDTSELASAERFKGAHDQLQKLKIKQVIASAGLAASDWISGHDSYQFIMVRRNVVENVRLQDAFVVFDLKDGRKPFTTAWGDTEQAAEKFRAISAQFKK